MLNKFPDLNGFLFKIQSVSSILIFVCLYKWTTKETIWIILVPKTYILLKLH